MNGQRVRDAALWALFAAIGFAAGYALWIVSQKWGRRNMKLRKVLSIVTVLSVMGLAGYSYAAWTKASNVVGYAKATSLSSFTSVDISATVAADLFPGAVTPGHLRINNPNAVPMTITQSAQNGPPVSTDTSACPSSNLNVILVSGLSINVPASASNFDVTIPGQLQLAAGAPTGCQGIGFTVPVTVTATT